MSATINFGSQTSRQITMEHPSLELGYVLPQTYFCRPDIDWLDLGNYITKDFKKPPKVYNGACSDGSEAFGLKLILQHLAPDKKFEIQAFDINADIIKNAQQGLIRIYDRCVREVQNLRSGQMEYFHDNFTLIPGTRFRDEDGKEGDLYKVSEDFRKGISFEEADVIEFAKRKHKKPCVFMFRNVLPYIKKEKREELFDDLGHNLARGSLFVNGEYDEREMWTNTGAMLIKAFNRIGHHIFLKR